MKTLLKHWPIVTFLAGVLASGAWQVHLHLLEDVARDNRLDHQQEQIRVLLNVAVAEHPAYSPVLFPGVR